MPPKPRYRLASENSDMWDKLINSAEKAILEEGISSLTAGCLAKEFNLKRPTIHYYWHNRGSDRHSNPRQFKKKLKTVLLQRLKQAPLDSNLELGEAVLR